MATWDITVPAGSAVGGTGTGSSAITEPGDFDNATITDVSVVGSPTVTSDSTTDDTIGIRWRIQTSTSTAIWGDYGSDAASACSASLGDGVSSSTITDGSSPSPAPSTAVAADWDEVAYNANYAANMKDDGEQVSWSSFTIRVTDTPGAGTDNLTADDVESSSEVTSPAVGQEHALLANDVESSSELTSPAVGQEHALLANDVESLTELTAPALLEVIPITAEDVESASEVSSPSVGQEHAILASSVESTSELTAPAVGQTHGLLANDVESSTELTSPSLGQAHALLANDVESVSELSSPTLAEGSGSTYPLYSNKLGGASGLGWPI